MSGVDFKDKVQNSDPLENSIARALNLDTKVKELMKKNHLHAMKFAMNTWNEVNDLVHDSLPKENITQNTIMALYRGIILDYAQRAISGAQQAEFEALKQKGWIKDK